VASYALVTQIHSHMKLLHAINLRLEIVRRTIHFAKKLNPCHANRRPLVVGLKDSHMVNLPDTSLSVIA